MRISFKKRCSIFPSPKEVYRYCIKTIKKYNNQVCLQNCTDNKLIDRSTMGKTQRDQPFNKERGQAPGGTQKGVKSGEPSDGGGGSRGVGCTHPLLVLPRFATARTHFAACAGSVALNSKESACLTSSAPGGRRCAHTQEILCSCFPLGYLSNEESQGRRRLHETPSTRPVIFSLYFVSL